MLIFHCLARFIKLGVLVTYLGLHTLDIGGDLVDSRSVHIGGKPRCGFGIGKGYGRYPLFKGRFYRAWGPY
jgi:hypothetical protein